MKTSVNALIWFNFFVWRGLVAGFLFPVMSIVLYIVLSAVTLASRRITELLIWSMTVTKFVPDFFVQNPTIAILLMVSTFVVIKFFNVAGSALVFSLLVRGKSLTKQIIVRPDSESHIFYLPNGGFLAFTVNGDRVFMEPGGSGPTHPIVSRIVFDMFESRCDKAGEKIIDDSNVIRREVGWPTKIWSFLFL